MGSEALEGRVEMGEKEVTNIKTYTDGHRPLNLVVPSIV